MKEFLRVLNESLSWSRAEADEFASILDDALDGFDVRIVGSVAEKGKSDKDLDLLLTMNETGEEYEGIDDPVWTAMTSLGAEFRGSRDDEGYDCWQLPNGKVVDLFTSAQQLDEGLGSEYGSRREFLTVLLNYIRDQIDSEMTREEFMDSYREVMSNLKFPLTIYRALHWTEVESDFNAREDDWQTYFDPEDDYKLAGKAQLEAAIKSVDFNKIGLSWTWDRDCATEGGVLGGGGFDSKGAHVILTAVVKASQVDLLSTIFQNLTVFQEEKEVRLWPNMALKIVNIEPNVGIKLPIRSNTGATQHDGRDDIIDTLRWNEKSRARRG